MNLFPNAGRGARPTTRRPGRAGKLAGTAALAVTAALALAAPAGASAGHRATPAAGRPAAPRGGWTYAALHLRAMPVGAVRFGRRHGWLTVHAAVFGLTPGSAHGVDLVLPGQHWRVPFGPLQANGVGQADATLGSHYAGGVPRGSRLVIRMGTAAHGVAAEPIAVTAPLPGLSRHPHRLIAVEAGRPRPRSGPLRGRATLSYNSARHTLTVTVTASGLTPGAHAAHIHLGSCMSQGPVKYMLGDLIAGARGRIVHAVRVLRNITAPIPPHGWYVNIHQGTTRTILHGGQPTIFFRPLLCADVGGPGVMARE